jgi:hypothetical protein
MKTLLLNLMIWVMGVAILFLLGGMVTYTTHATNTGLGIFILGSFAWTFYLLRNVINQVVRR